MAGFLFVGAVFTTTILWHFGIIRASTNDLAYSSAAFAAGLDYAWNLVHAIPSLNITDVMHWERPDQFASDRIQGSLVLLFEVGVILPAIAYVIHRFRDKGVADPEQPFDDPPSVIAVVDVIASKESSDERTVQDWNLIFGEAAEELNAQDSQRIFRGRWTAEKIRREVVGVLG
jgi:hypothetical protein